ncbi:MAG: single-stranded DNA-binding protein, partial [Microbacteriaceae bacterium]
WFPSLPAGVVSGCLRGDTVPMTDTITITGLVATAPRHLVTGEGLPITSFRLASSQRRFDRAKQRWVDGETNWYTVTAFRQLAMNLVSSADKGDRVIVTGRVRIRNWESGERTGTTVDIEADAVGHDLTWGTAQFHRSIAVSSSESASPAGDASWAGAGGQDNDGAGGPENVEEDDARQDEQAITESDRVPVPF